MESSKRCFSNILGYIKDVFKYATKQELLIRNPCDLINTGPIRGRCKDSNKKTEDRILEVEEMNKLIETLHTCQHENESYIQNYAIEFATLTGMRVGEIAALRWDSIDDKCIHIDYSEHRIDYADKPCEYYIGEPKNRKHRVFPLSREIKDLLNRIRQVHEKYQIDSEYIFSNKQGRVNSHTISCAMTRRCKDAGIEKKSIHAIRRTVSSHLRTLLPVATVSNLLGHLEETNTRHYNYDIVAEDIKLASIEKLYTIFKNAS